MRKNFEAVFGPACGEGDDELVLRTSTFDFREQALCRSTRKFMYPKRGQLANGREFRFIINTRKHPQGVTVERCLAETRGISSLLQKVFLLFQENSVVNFCKAYLRNFILGKLSYKLKTQYSQGMCFVFRAILQVQRIRGKLP